MNLVGVVLENRYRILDTIGVGGMGTVYLAEHVHLGDLVAVKVLSPLFAWDQEWIDRFLLEARSATRIRQENVVQVKDFGYPAPGLVYMVMEAIRGESLTDLLAREGPLPWRRALRIADHVAAALEAAHACGIIHRDIKPSNCIRTALHGDPDFIKVLDFGIAKLTSGNDDSDFAPQTAGGVWMGTAEYMAPETFRGAKPEASVDIYAVGVVLYKLLTDTTPFQGTHAQIARELATRDAPPPSRVAPGRDIPQVVDSLVLRALARDPAMRTPSMTALRDELAAAFEAPEVDVPRPRTPAPKTAPPKTGQPISVAAAVVAEAMATAGGQRIKIEKSDAVVARPGPSSASSSRSTAPPPNAEVPGPAPRRRLTGLLAIMPDPPEQGAGDPAASGSGRMATRPMNLPPGGEMAPSSPAAAIDRAGARRLSGRLPTMSAVAMAAAAAAASASSSGAMAASASASNPAIDQTPAGRQGPPRPTVPATVAAHLLPKRTTIILAASAFIGLLTFMMMLWRIVTPKVPDAEVVAEANVEAKAEAEAVEADKAADKGDAGEVAPVEPVAPVVVPPAVEPAVEPPPAPTEAVKPTAIKPKTGKTPVPRSPPKALILEAVGKAEEECRARPGLRPDASVTLSLVISKRGTTRVVKKASNSESYYGCLRKKLKVAKFGASKKGTVFRYTFTAK